jgi:hypothetical protein
LIFGKKLAVLGTVLGAIYTPERAAAAEKALGDLGGNIKEGAIKALAYLGLSLPSLLTIANTIGDGAVKGLQGLADLTSGDLDKFKENWKEAAIVLGTMAAIFAPKGWIMGIIRFLGSKRAFLAGIASLLGFSLVGDEIKGEGGSSATTAAVGAYAAARTAPKAFAKTSEAIANRTATPVSQVAEEIADHHKGKLGVIPEKMRGKFAYSKKSGDLMVAGKDGKATMTRATQAQIDKIGFKSVPKKGWWKALLKETTVGKGFLKILGTTARSLPAVAAIVTILDGYEMYQIYYGEGVYADLPWDQRKQEMGRLLGSIMGTTALVALGISLGTAAGVSFFGVGAAFGAVIGGVAGAGASMFVDASDLGISVIDALFFAGSSFGWSKADPKVKELKEVAAKAQGGNPLKNGDTISGQEGNTTLSGNAGTDNLSTPHLSAASAARSGKAPSISAIGNGFNPGIGGFGINGRGDNSPIVNVDASTTQAASSQYTLIPNPPIPGLNPFPIADIEGAFPLRAAEAADRCGVERLSVPALPERVVFPSWPDIVSPFLRGFPP